MKIPAAAAVILLAFVASCGDSTSPDVVPPGFRIGGDISFLQEIEEHGGVYSDADGEKDLLFLLKEHGFNSIRLRLWHTPDGTYSTLERVQAMATRVHAAGLDLFLDFHYSDWWADAGSQGKPAAWADLEFDVLVDSVYQYSHDVIASLRAHGTLPAIVQIGNEIRGGLLWPDGRVGGAYDTSEQWDRLVTLLDAGRRGVLDAAGSDTPEILIHIDAGSDTQLGRWFFDGLTQRGLAFDAIGVSYYAKWHGTLDGLARNLTMLAERYDRDVYVVETAYPWTFNWVDESNNLFGTQADLLDGYPPSIEGQAAFLRALRQIVLEVPGDRGAGVFYWAPEWIAVEGVPSAWENATLFNFAGQMLASLEVFTGTE